MPTARKQKTPTPNTEESDGPGWISLSLAARLLGTTYSTTASRALKGEFRTVNYAGRTYINRADVERAVKAEA